MGDTTVDTTITTTEPSLLPVPTAFRMVAQSETMGKLVVYTNGQGVMASTYPFPVSWSRSIAYNDETRYPMVDDTPLCIAYDLSGRLAAIGCGSVVTGQSYHLTCEPPSDAGLVCDIPAMRCDDRGYADLGKIWNKFYLLGFDEGVWMILIGADDLSTSDAPMQGIWPIGMTIEAGLMLALSQLVDMFR
ncbi:hypothetical protein FSPOR_1760 [Fusarium sporotrichioides]|uniref:Uncharacterized protein n=1 Tax=Fusarium sporotrichioides TaxID=5514 RepID=A0A395SQ01_FUSSP|nr:hypothetical protein FSPOR_1760 [Fusarium sporotrichioides]